MILLFEQFGMDKTGARCDDTSGTCFMCYNGHSIAMTAERSKESRA